MSLLQAAGNGYLKSSYEGEKCIEVAYIELSAGWVATRTAGYLIWTEAPQLLDCSTRASQKRIHFALKSTDYFCMHTYISPSLQSTMRITRPLKSQLIDAQDNLCRLIHSLINGVISQKASVAHSIKCSVMDWKKRFLFPAANDFALGKNKCSQGETDSTPSSSTQRKDAWSFTSIPSECFHSVLQG
jgi:hypothetical protein